MLFPPIFLRGVSLKTHGNTSHGCFPAISPSHLVRNPHQEFVRVVTNVGGNLDNLKRLKVEQEQMLLNTKLEQIRYVLRDELKPFRSFPVVDQFLAQFTEIRSRYRFLVIEGQSKTGKTVFTKWITGNPDRVFETNCACCPEPDLREFRSLFHDTILFDEAAPEMVISQKKLFQGPPCFVELGCSSTNCHSYKVLVSGTRLVICSNGWTEALEMMPKESDRQWPVDNSFVVNVGRTPMYT